MRDLFGHASLRPLSSFLCRTFLYELGLRGDRENRWTGSCGMIADSSGIQNVNYYLSFYKNFFLRAWNGITPMQYGFLLVSVAVIGYLLMKSGAKTHS
jgi:hypothetical protein